MLVFICKLLLTLSMNVCTVHKNKWWACCYKGVPTTPTHENIVSVWIQIGENFRNEYIYIYIYIVCVCVCVCVTHCTVSFRMTDHCVGIKHRSDFFFSCTDWLTECWFSQKSNIVISAAWVLNDLVNCTDLQLYGLNTGVLRTNNGITCRQVEIILWIMAK